MAVAQRMTVAEFALELWCRAASGRGEVVLPIDVALDEHNCFGPDLLCYREGRGPGRSEVRPQPMPAFALALDELFGAPAT